MDTNNVHLIPSQLTLLICVAKQAIVCILLSNIQCSMRYMPIHTFSLVEMPKKSITSLISDNQLMAEAESGCYCWSESHYFSGDYLYFDLVTSKG
jgi:hypothetical protein